MKNFTLANIYFKDLQSILYRTYCDNSTYPDLNFLANRDSEQIIKDFQTALPKRLLNEDRDTLNQGVNPCVYSFEWG